MTINIYTLLNIPVKLVLETGSSSSGSSGLFILSGTGASKLVSPMYPSFTLLKPKILLNRFNILVILSSFL